MRKTFNNRLWIGFLLLLTACSVEISETTPAATQPLPPTPPGTGVQATTPAVVQLNTATVPAASATPTTRWAKFNLTGALVYTQGTEGLFKLNLVTGEKIQLLPEQDRTWLAAATVSPDGQTIVLAYAPPPAGDEPQLGYTGLYRMPNDGSMATPEPILERADPQESYFLPAWTADGQYLYFSHFTPIRDQSGNTFKYTIERMAYPDGKPEVLIEDAIWPRPSPDGAQLAYLKFDPEDFSQSLYLSDLDGQNPVALVAESDFPSVDAQFFAPDSRTLIFNGVGEGKSPALTWLDWLTGVQVARAHSVPSDWWKITLGETQPPVRLTELYDTGMYGDFSPDGQYVAFLSASGIYVMKPDGSEITPVVPIDNLGTLEWVP